ncbi:hypothetical protein GCM10022380_06810 [Amycolatopsis tucumanensis]|uniref:Uncharacterized protein n=1 Tax=Amycolatopsis tucumanensis TaxID=401106 RepID=A0ABP7HIF4_9PSEU
MSEAVGLHREHQARPHRFAVDEHGARAADPVLAAEMGAGQSEIVAQGVGRRAPRFDVELVTGAVDGGGTLWLFSVGAGVYSDPVSPQNGAPGRHLRGIRCSVGSHDLT